MLEVWQYVKFLAAQITSIFFISFNSHEIGQPNVQERLYRVSNKTARSYINRVQRKPGTSRDLHHYISYMIVKNHIKMHDKLSNNNWEH